MYYAMGYLTILSYARSSMYSVFYNGYQADVNSLHVDSKN